MQRPGCAIGGDGGRSVEIPELDIQIVGLQLIVLSAQIRRGSRDVTRISLLDRELADRPPLEVIACKQIGSGVTVEDEGELPGEIVRIMDSGIAAKAAVRRHYVGGVASDEHPPHTIAARHVGDRAPAGDAVDLYRDVRRADRGAH